MHGLEPRTVDICYDYCCSLQQTVFQIMVGILECKYLFQNSILPLSFICLSCCSAYDVEQGRGVCDLLLQHFCFNCSLYTSTTVFSSIVRVSRFAHTTAA